MTESVRLAGMEPRSDSKAAVIRCSVSRHPTDRELAAQWMHWAQIAALLLPAFFSIAETALMAISRLRPRHLAREVSARRYPGYLAAGLEGQASARACALSTTFGRLPRLIERGKRNG